MREHGYVLVADDEPEIRTLIGSVLLAEGYSVRETRDGTTALSTGSEERPVAAVLDYMMPGLSGVDVGVELRQLYGPELPLVFVSAIRIPEHELRRVDAYLFLSKPFNIDELAEAVASAVREPAPHALLARDTSDDQDRQEVAQSG